MRLAALPLGVVLTLLAALPSYFNPTTDRIFEEEKSLLLRAAALFAAPAIIALWSSDMRAIVRHPVVVAFAAFVASWAIATMLAIAPHDALWGAYLRRHGFLTWAALAVLFASLLSAARSETARVLVIRAAVIGALWPSLYLLTQRLGLDPIHWIAPSQGFQSGGTFGNHVLTGGYLALVIPLTAFETMRSGKAWGLLLLCEIAALGASGSRGAALALGAGAASAALVLTWRLVSLRAAMTVLVTGAVAVAAIGLIPALQPAWVARQFNPQAGSARVRVLIWRDTSDVIRNAGARSVFGYGPESLPLVIPKYYSPEIGVLEQIDAMPDRAHNETLDTLVGAGLIGTLVQFAMIFFVLRAIMQIQDTALSCALAASVVAHLVEIQFGIASVTTRLGFVALAAVSVGVRIAAKPDEVVTARSRWIIVAAVVGAAAPWILMLPMKLSNPIASGGEAQFIAYLHRMSSATPFVYASFLAVALAIGRSSAARRPREDDAWWRLPLFGGAVWVALVVSIGPSRSDAITAAGRSYEAAQRWPEATAAYAAAARERPDVAEYQTSLGRASAEWAMRSETPASERLIDQAGTALRKASSLNIHDIEAQRRLSAYQRVRASLLHGDARAAALAEADRRYAAISVAAPAWPPAWVEWAWVDLDRGLPDAAAAKVGRALALSPRRADALALQSRLAGGNSQPAPLPHRLR